MKASQPVEKLNWPLMADNILPEDRQAVIEFLKHNDRLTQWKEVRAFEKEWSEWIGVKHSVFVNSGASANLITLAALKEIAGPGEVIVPTLTWVSDIASVLQNGFTPVFVDINPRHLGMAEDEVAKKITPKTKAVFLTHILGYNALTDGLMKTLKEKNIPLIEDGCESHGARFKGKRIGSFGWASNFSFYYAHHLSTVEGGMVCTNDDELYQMMRMFRSHGLVREMDDESLKKRYHEKYPDLDTQFIFAFPAYNVRSTEINAVFGRNQLKRLQDEIDERNENLKVFLGGLDPAKYRTDFELEGVSNYALTLVLQKNFTDRAEKVTKMLVEANVEYRRGTSGGGNQLRQPYLKRLFGDAYKNYPEVEHVHFYAYYIGNYPGLDKGLIKKLCAMLNSID
ncbi:MAG TPA: DegT/DnrJ/EryC1/StrS aminotransferase family protein [Verrucomicrobiae bacterium]|jgi:CDP-6-deoxy-D-xylo-4-hexulose-3-dehydrase|nr:DegT/DnrJ/EryC1/StrS aminotransferase family protein [Verrucomicrobiae bacterium]